MHLKNPKVVGRALLQGVKPFILILNEGIPQKGKVCKFFDPIATTDLAVKISGPNLTNKEWFTMHEEIVVESFARGFNFEVIGVEKNASMDFA